MLSASARQIRGIYVVTDDRGAPGRDHEAIAAAAARGGASCVQLREKNLSDRELLELARKMKSVTLGSCTLFIINDRLDIALACGSDGAHVGQDDIPARTAREILGPDAIVGVSAGSPEEAIRAEADGATYVAIGPVFATATKPDAGAAVGLEAVTQIKRAVKIPVVAIGGISLANIASVAAAGADAAAVASAIVGAPDMAEAVRALAREFSRGLDQAPSGGRAS
jgi:thiamine-phosphate pyrophosphorylase